MKKIIAVLGILTILTLPLMSFAAAVPAQVGGNDWTRVGPGLKFGPEPLTAADGTVTNGHYYEVFYSPSSASRAGAVVTFSLKSVYTDTTSTIFYSMSLNCQTRQYTFAQYDMSVTPATLGKASAWKDIMPNTAGDTTFPVFCK